MDDDFSGFALILNGLPHLAEEVDFQMSAIPTGESWELSDAEVRELDLSFVATREDPSYY